MGFINQLITGGHHPVAEPWKPKSDVSSTILPQTKPEKTNSDGFLNIVGSRYFDGHQNGAHVPFLVQVL